MLSSLHDSGVRLALVTNGGSEGQRAKIDRFGLASFFDCIVVEGEFGFGKPDERVFGHALGQLAVAASNAWMVGDDLDRDIAGAQSVGIFGIWIDMKGAGLRESDAVRPDRVITSLPELLSLSR